MPYSLDTSEGPNSIISSTIDFTEHRETDSSPLIFYELVDDVNSLTAAPVTDTTYSENMNNYQSRLTCEFDTALNILSYSIHCINLHRSQYFPLAMNKVGVDSLN